MNFRLLSVLLPAIAMMLVACGGKSRMGVEFVSVPDGEGGGPGALEFPVTISWRMTGGSGDDSNPYELELSVPKNSVLSISPEGIQSGAVASDEVVSNQFTGTCLREGSVTVSVETRIIDLSDTARFTLVCDPDAARLKQLVWYQVPWVATESVRYVDTATTGGTSTIEYNTPVVPDRRAVVSVVFAHGYDELKELVTATWEDATPNSVRDMTQATDRTMVRNPDEDSTFPWATVYHFHLDADQVTSENSPALVLQSEKMEAAFRSELSDLAFEDIVTFRPVFLPFVLNQGENPDPAPDWDDDNMLGNTRDWLPVGKDDPRRYDTIWVDSLPGGFNKNFWVLDETAIYFNREGEADEFFHGLLFHGLNGLSAGGGVAYLSWQVGMSCVQAGGASNPNEIVYGTAVVAHEFGHNWSRPHAPGCGAGGPDPDYPYPGPGSIGDVLYWSYEDDRFVSGDDGYYSFMSYCGPEFTSDYDYRLAAEYFIRRSIDWAQDDAPPASAYVSDQPRSIALMARFNLETGEWKLLQAEYSSKPPRQSEGGDFELVVMNHQGIESHRETIKMAERMIRLPDGKHVEDWERTWMARVPIPEGGIGSIQVLDGLRKQSFETALKLPAKQENEFEG